MVAGSQPSTTATGKVRAERDCDGKRLPRKSPRVVAEVQCAAAMREPAHDRTIRADDLLPIDAQVLARLVRAAGDHQSPGDQRCDVAGPAGLHRQSAKIDRLSLPDLLLTRRRGDLARRHAEHLAQHRQLLPRVLQAFRGLGFLQVGQQRAHLAQRLHRLFAHAERNTPRRAEQIGQHRKTPAARAVRGVLEDQRRSVLAQHAIGDLGHFVSW
jgi:hypothetical protein